ncbi:MAG: hypothetical protein KGI25_09805, partial [Thaumarchaeota archaeon]|nr:hypothetical protein [Nitrososphaerota archaeon]
MTKKIPELNIRTLKKNILFLFEDDFTNLNDKKINQRGFREVTASGIIVVSPTTNAEKARWGVVIKVGPECSDDIKVGSRILIEKLMWTNGAK